MQLIITTRPAPMPTPIIPMPPLVPARLAFTISVNNVPRGNTITEHIRKTVIFLIHVFTAHFVNAFLISKLRTGAEIIAIKNTGAVDIILYNWI